MKKIRLFFFPIFAAFLFASFVSVGIAKIKPLSSDDVLQDNLTRFRQARQDFKNERAREAVEAAAVVKEKVQTRLEELKQAREATRVRMENKRKEVLLKLVDIQILWMERAKERIQKMPNITDALKTQLAGAVDEAIQNLESEKTKIQSAEGMDAIKALAKEVRDLFKSKREIVKEIVDAIHASRAENATAKAEDRVAAMKVKMQEMKDKGKNTVEIESDLEDAQEDIASAREAIGRKAFREANEDLKGAYQTFRNIAQKAKGLR